MSITLPSPAAFRHSINIMTKTPTDTPAPDAKDATAPVTTSDTPATTPPSGKTGNKTMWIGTAAGIGSAAIVAALLYTKRKS
jgi:LPXTG-motif cell wall-anchored protein